MCMCIFTLQVLNHSGGEEAYLVFADKCKATTWETQRCFAFFALPYGWGEGSCFTSQTESICAQARGLLVRWDLARLTWRAVLWFTGCLPMCGYSCDCPSHTSQLQHPAPWHEHDCIQGSAPKHENAPTDALLHSHWQSAESIPRKFHSLNI